MERKNDSFFGNVLHGIQGRLKKVSNSKYKKAGLNWYRIKYLKHLPYGKSQVYHFRGRDIHFANGPELYHSLQEIFVEEVYAIDFKKPDPYIIDCGANIGLSLIYQLIKYPGARISAFEPDRSSFEHLQKNVPIADHSKVKLYNEAIWKENTTLNFQAEGSLGSKISNESTAPDIIQVKATRLKDLLSERVDFLKLDIEGAEYEVLKDCQENLHMAERIFIEFHGHFQRMHELTEILQMVERNNFAFYIKEATNVYPTPFCRKADKNDYDIQLNIFCFKI